MNTKTFLVPFLAVLTLLALSFVSATTLLANIDSVTFNEVELELYSGGSVNVAGFAGENVPVRVTFTSNVDSTDVKIKVEIYSGRDDFTASTGRFNVVDGNTYTKLLSVQLPDDLKQETKDLTLHVRIYDANNDNEDTEKSYVIKMQRESYEFDILSVDYNTEVSAGEFFPVVVVVKKTGFERADDGYVVVSIPELGVSSRGYFGYLSATETCTLSEDYYNNQIVIENCDDDDEDSTQKTVYLKIPENAESGIYELQVKAYNSDSSTSVSNLIKVDTSASTQVLAAVKNQDMSAGETKTYDLIIVNSADNVKVYNLQAVSGTSLSVSAPSVVTVGPDSSTTVPITVTASSNAEVGTYTFSVDVDGQQVIFGANVTGSARASSSVVALTVILVIIFVVLLIVLLVLLTRKEKPIEEAETSYY